MRTKATVRMLNGYRVIYLPDHSRAMTSENWKGYVYEHLVEAEKSLGRALRAEEVVHHLDEDKIHNAHNNLLILENAQHSKLHAWLRGNQRKVRACSGGCGVWVRGRADKCLQCYKKDKKERSPCPSREILAKQLKTESMEEIGRSYGVTGAAVKKWSKRYGLPCGRKAE